MKVIFLDIDGVLNSTRSCIAFGGYPWPDSNWEWFDMVAVRLLRKLIKETGSKVVLSSSWRTTLAGDRWNQLQNFLGISFLDRTRSDIMSYNRGDEIQQWINDCKEEVDAYVIIDDMEPSTFHKHQQPNFIHVNHEDGFSYDNFYQAAKILGVEDNE